MGKKLRPFRFYELSIDRERLSVSRNYILALTKNSQKVIPHQNLVALKKLKQSRYSSSRFSNRRHGIQFIGGRKGRSDSRTHDQARTRHDRKQLLEIGDIFVRNIAEGDSHPKVRI